MMNGRSTAGHWLFAIRSLAIACATAALGFTVSFATAPTEPASRSASAAAGRATVGEPLRFTNPFLLAGSDPFFPLGGATQNDPQGFDLGDVAPGAAIVRYVTATGGFLPYRFGARGLSANSNTLSTSFVVPLLLPFGKLSTVIPSTAVGALRFEVLLTDFLKNTRQGNFKLNVVDPGPDVLRFAQDRLPTAQQGRSYFTNIQTVGGSGKVTFLVGENSVVVNNVTLKRLEDAGLSLSSDGTLFGRPIKGFDISFKVSAHDEVGHKALARFGNTEDFTFTVTVDKGLPVTTEIAATQCMVKGSTPLPDVTITSDTLTYSGYLDPKSDTFATLAGTDFVMRVGTAGSLSGGVLSGKFDAKGKVRTPITLPDNKKTGQLNVSLSTSGKFTVKASGLSLGSAVGAGGTGFSDLTLQPLILGFEVGNNYRTCEVLQTETRLHSGHFSLNYALGKRGYSRAGACQILSVRGVDTPGNAKNAGTSWLIKVLGVPAQDDPGTATKGFPAPKASATILAGTHATFVIGSYSQDVTLALKQVRLEFKATKADKGIFQALTDPKKFVHRIQTNILSESDTGIPQAISTKLATIFPFAMIITNFSGENGRVIVPDRGVWSQQ